MHLCKVWTRIENKFSIQVTTMFQHFGTLETLTYLSVFRNSSKVEGTVICPAQLTSSQNDETAKFRKNFTSSNYCPFLSQNVQKITWKLRTKSVHYSPRWNQLPSFFQDKKVSENEERVFWKGSFSHWAERSNKKVNKPGRFNAYTVTGARSPLLATPISRLSKKGRVCETLRRQRDSSAAFIGLFPSNGVWRREERLERGIARLSAFSFGSGTSDNGEGP